MKLVLLAIQMLIFLSPLGAQDPLERYFPAASLDKLRAGKTLSASVPADWGLSLLPSIASGESISADLKTRQPSIGVEISSIIAGLPRQMDTREGWLMLYNSLHAVSTMKGIPYYSFSRGTNRVLFTESYVVDSTSRKERVADSTFSEIPVEDLIYTFQEDGTFGKNVYEESFSFRDDHLLVSIRNMTTISFLFLPLIQPGDLVSRIALIPNGKDVAFYGVSYLSTSFPMGDRHSREESLKNRLTAMANWLKGRLDGGAQ